MSAVAYSEPGKLPAGILAIAVHGAFFALLYFGFTWQTSPPVMMSVELWDSLPAVAVAVAPPPPPKKVMEPDISPPVPVKIEEAAQPEKVPEKVIEPPDIAIPDKQKTALESARLAKLKRDQAERSKAERERVDREQAEREQTEREQAAREQAARESAMRAQAEKEAAIGKVVDEYRAKIMTKIRRNIVMPANVADDARSEFSVTLLPGGAVLEAKLLKPSGNAAYDSAVERAIIKSDPLPLPPDVAMFNKFRKLNLVFKPTE